MNYIPILDTFLTLCRNSEFLIHILDEQSESPFWFISHFSQNNLHPPGHNVTFILILFFGPTFLLRRSGPFCQILTSVEAPVRLTCSKLLIFLTKRVNRYPLQRRLLWSLLVTKTSLTSILIYIMLDGTGIEVNTVMI